MNITAVICSVNIITSLTPPPDQLIDVYQDVYSCQQSDSILPSEYHKSYMADISNYFPQMSQVITLQDLDITQASEITSGSVPDMIILPTSSSKNVPVNVELYSMIELVRSGAIPMAKLEVARAEEQRKQRLFWCSLSLDLCPIGWYLPMGVSDELLYDLEDGLYIAPSWYRAPGWPLPRRIFDLQGSVILPLHDDLMPGGGVSASFDSTMANGKRFADYDLLPASISWSEMGFSFNAHRAGDQYHVTTEVGARALLAAKGYSLRLWSKNNKESLSLASLATQGFAWIAFSISLVNFVFFGAIIFALISRVTFSSRRSS